MDLATFWQQLTVAQALLCLGLFGLTVWAVVSALTVIKVVTTARDLTRDS